MTMTDNSPPPSPGTCEKDDRETSTAADTIISVATLLRRPSQPVPLHLSAVNRNLCYNFPSPPLSTSSSPRSPSSPRISPVSASSRQARMHTRNTSRTVSVHSRRRSSLSVCSFHASQLEEQFGPPPHPAPTTPLPPVPGAPRLPFTTPQQERNRYSSYELMEKLRRLETQTEDEGRSKRHSAPPGKLRRVVSPSSVPALRGGPGVRRYVFPSTERERERGVAGRSIEERLERTQI